ncbi:hypothetical protein H9L10_03495 [Phycicoccus endophyticus]|uniref:Uncharacterized protein n=1 Tax=Phycicoccus endophyticus TaxID=1690220 RepID=A0A7G9R3F8_9MICO|nr:hypothetical protein [Phycicoccus endophyticus]NHI19889.1 hypothetical protein [Phycicoccus endophyticus]QNN50133.1 hypothetical protein H9L10_03495 [Phycicoccus endophyticus]GGL27748.1 hypothetical protein GCM10012283_07440 [Phycicoccus endophyticus]
MASEPLTGTTYWDPSSVDGATYLNDAIDQLRRYGVARFPSATARDQALTAANLTPDVVPVCRLDDSPSSLWVWDGTEWCEHVKDTERVVTMWKGYVSDSSTAVPPGANYTLPMTEEISSGAAWDAAGATSIRTVPLDGIYRLRVQISTAQVANVNGNLQVGVKLNVTDTDMDTGSLIVWKQLDVSTSGRLGVSAEESVALSAGDTLAYYVRHGIGTGTFDLMGGNTYASFMEIEYAGVQS